ncbi:MAG: hypothetical protein KAH84_04585 [Thiomargarita sp.]|nr:hypothetical protein [Thiomargarita sp.]
MKLNFYWQKSLKFNCLLLLFLSLFYSSAQANLSAIKALLLEAKDYYVEKQFEQAAASLERALRIEPRHPILWHNLAGIRLSQEDWKRAANLAQKSNSLVGVEKKYKKLRMRNWVIVTLACEGMDDANCAHEARRRAQALAQQE